MHFDFDNSYARELPGTYVAGTRRHAGPRACCTWSADWPTSWAWRRRAGRPEGAALFAGNALPEGAEPIAQAYAGHQFGGFSPQLGDGRALLMGELDRPPRPAPRHPAQGFGAHALFARRRRQGRRRPDAARSTDRRGHARAGHPDHARAGGGGHRRAGAARGAAARRRADARGRQPPARGHLPVLCRARRRGDKLRQLADYAIARHYPDLAGTPRPLSWLCCAPWPSARRG